MTLVQLMIAALVAVGVVWAAESFTSPPATRVIQFVVLAALVIAFVLFFLLPLAEQGT